MKPFGLLLIVASLWGQNNQQALLASYGGVAAVSNILTTQSVACTSGATTGNPSPSCTITSTGAGNLLVAVVDYPDTTTAAPAVPSDGSNTYVLAGSQMNTALGGSLAVYYVASSVSGATSLVIHPASGHTNTCFMEFSGTKTSSPLDLISSSLTANTATTAWINPPALTAQTDLVIGFSANQLTATPAQAAAGVFNESKNAPQGSDGANLFCEWVRNAAESQYFATGTGNSSSYYVGMVAFKSAVAGSATGDFPSTFINFSGGTNSATPTPTDLLVGTHGGNGTYAAGALTGATYQNTYTPTPATCGLVTQNLLGTTYSTASPVGWQYEYQTGTNVSARYNFTPASATTASMRICMSYPSLLPDTGVHNIFGIYGTTSRINPYMRNLSSTQNQLFIETESGDSTGVNIPASATALLVSVEFVGGGTASMTIQDCSSGSCSTLGTVTHAMAADAPASIRWGAPGGSPIGSSYIIKTGIITADFSASPVYP